MTDSNTQALDDHLSEQDELDAMIKEVKYDHEDYIELLRESIPNNFEHDILDLVDYEYAIGTIGWEREASRIFNEWTDAIKAQAQHEAEQDVIKRYKHGVIL